MSQQQLKVMVSSTARDLPDHRKEVMDACLRQGMFPIMMEHLPAQDEEAIPASLKMIDEADVYLLILAHRYGHVPTANNPDQLSVTEWEYNRAVERKIRALIFVMHEDHPVKAADVEKGAGATKLDELKDRVQKKVVSFFKSPVDLRANVIDSLSDLRQPNLTQFHYVSDIPAPPETFIAHPYTLLQTHTLIGRQAELNLLTDWVTGKASNANVRQAAGGRVSVMSIIAIGGMGKSALTWKWFNEVAPKEMKHLAGRMWWSFFESDATFENFVIRALAYVSARPREEIQKLPVSEREEQLLGALKNGHFLIALDGIERILLAYAPIGAAHLTDNQVSSQRKLRKTTDPRAGRFLQKLAQVENSRILISSRLYPADLETDVGDCIPGTGRCEIMGLTDEDAVELWRVFEVTGSRDELLPVFSTFGKHPLLIQALAGEVRRFHRAPGDFAKWREANRYFDPTKFSRLQEAMGHVLEYALRGLDEKSQEILHTVAAFRMPARYDTLAALLVGNEKPCLSEKALDDALTELEERGLLGWDKRANRYDLHPIVRGVVWSRLGEEARRGVYVEMHAHFESLPPISESEVKSLDALTPAAELYNTLIGLERFQDAYELLSERMANKMMDLGATNELAALLEMLFPDGLEALPRLNDAEAQMTAIAYLGLTAQFRGLPGKATQRFLAANDIKNAVPALSSISELSGIIKMLIAWSLSYSGRLRMASGYSASSVLTSREGKDANSEGSALVFLGLALAVRGVDGDPESALERAFGMLKDRPSVALHFAPMYLAELALWRDNADLAHRYLQRLKELVVINVPRMAGVNLRTTRLEGAVAMASGDFARADELLHQVLTRSRDMSEAEVAIQSLIGLAELRLRQGDSNAAREFLDDVWELAERGPYPVFHADAFNMLAQIEHGENHVAAAIEAATKAYRLAWCDGPPFAYYWGLEKAKKHLKDLGAPEPDMPPFDESKFEPMPEVELDPDDEFHVGGAGDNSEAS